MPIPELRSTAAACAAAIAAHAAADNGAIALARPIDDITIDGDLSDWTDQNAWNSLEIAPGIRRDDPRAEFRVAYSEAEGAIFVAIRVPDDHHFVHEPDQRPADAAWLDEDGLLIYIDPIHAPSGSAPIVILVRETGASVSPQETSFDPAALEPRAVTLASAMRRTGDVSTYEVCIELGDHVRADRSLGLDVISIDVDAPSEPPNPADRLTLWGPAYGKSRAAGRIGDLILLDSDRGTGRVSGSVEWAEGADAGEHYLLHVRFQSLTTPGLWAQSVTNDDRFEAELPEGEYLVYPPFPFAGILYSVQIPDTRVDRVRVRAGETTEPRIEWSHQALASPSTRPGLLFGFHPSDEPELDAYIRQLMEHFRVPGASVALVRDGEVVYDKQFGVANRATREPVGPDTPFDIASVTKMVFAYAVNRLIDRGELDLNTPLVEYLPDRVVESDDRSDRLTAYHVLTHTTGLPNWGLRFENDPGTEYGYSGEGFELLGRAVAQLTGKPLEEVYREEVLTPLGMTETHVVRDENLAEAVALGHRNALPIAPIIDGRRGTAWGMYTTTGDLCKFMVALMDARGLSDDQFDSMMGQHTPIGEYNDVGWPAYFGLGLGVGETPDGPTFGHTGRNPGSDSIFEAYPEQNAGFVVLTNGETGPRLYRPLRTYLVTGGKTAEDAGVSE